MKFLEETVSRILDDIGVSHLSVAVSSTALVPELDERISAQEVLSKIRSDPRYALRLSPHPFGFFLFYENASFPKQRALVDYAIDFRVKRGTVMSVRAAMKVGRVFTPSGQVRVCFTPEHFRRVLGETVSDERADREAEALG